MNDAFDIEAIEIEGDLHDAEFSEELNDWLRVIAETCVAHMKFVEDKGEEDPEALTEEDYGLLELERGFLVLYALQTKGGLPVQVKQESKH